MLLKLWERPAPKDCLSWRVDSLFDLVKGKPLPAQTTPKTLNLRLRSTDEARAESPKSTKN